MCSILHQSWYSVTNVEKWKTSLGMTSRVQPRYCFIMTSCLLTILRKHVVWVKNDETTLPQCTNHHLHHQTTRLSNRLQIGPVCASYRKPLDQPDQYPSRQLVRCVHCCHRGLRKLQHKTAVAEISSETTHCSPR